MISIVKPLTYGRLGNFLFQAAAAIGYAKRHGLEFTLPDTTLNPKWNPIYLQHLLNKNYRSDAPIIEIQEAGHEYQDLPFDEAWREGKTIQLDGYWQTEKYFKDFRTDVLNLFALPWKPLPGFVSVHVRRTDYLTLKHKHPFISTEWITKAMAQFPGKHFIFFSDDIAWCKTTFGKRKDVTFSEKRTELEDLTYMSHCEHHICSASTFSWWGSWLGRNPEKRVIMPKNWFCPGHGNLKTHDIVPKEWERM